MLFVAFLPFDPSNFASTDVRSENTRLHTRLWTYISIETMKQTLEDKDKQLASAWKDAKAKAKAAEDSLKCVDDLKESN